MNMLTGAGPSRWIGLGVALMALLGLHEVLSRAQTGGVVDGVRVGYVDIDRIVDQSERIRKVGEDLKKQVDAIQTQIDQKIGKGQRLAKQLREQRSVLSDTQAVTLEDEMKQLSKDIRILEIEAEDLLKNSRSEQINPALRDVMTIIENIGETEKFDLILNGESVLFASKRLDLTDRVISSLDQGAVQSSGATKVTVPQGAKSAVGFSIQE